MTDTLTNPFAAMADQLPTRYAPGHTRSPYHYPDPNSWYPVIYYPVVDGDEKLWLVEPYPAGRADATHGLAPVEDDGGAFVAVVRRSAAPRPRVPGQRDGDWVIPGRAPGADSAYDMPAPDQKQLLAAWCEAHAVAAALNSGLVTALGLKHDDVEVLLAAERGVLVGDSRFAGTGRELGWTNPQDSHTRQTVGARQAKRLRTTVGAIEAGTVRDCKPARTEFSSAGVSFTETTYRLTRAGAGILAEIRAQYDGAVRCAVCGCTEEQACEGGCAWADPESDRLMIDVCTSCVGDVPDRLRA